jgi:hypothetical protein
MFVNGSDRNEQSVQRTFERCFLPSYSSFGQTVSEEKNFNKRKLNTESSIHVDASYQVLVHLVKTLQRRRFLKIDQSETRIECGGHVWKWIIAKCALFRENLP